MKQITINLYQFNELSKEAKQRAKDKYYELEDYPFLCDNLTERCKELLIEKGCKFQNIKLLYSLSWSQGDGLCFTGQIEKGKELLNLTHNYRYYFARSVTMELLNSEGDQMDIPEGNELVSIYFEVCKVLENEGYAELEYRMNDEEFSEHCDANNYTFESNGKMNNN